MHPVLALLFQTTALVGVHVVDVESGTLRRNQTVLVRGQTIAALGPTAAVAVPADATRVEGAGRFLIPGLVDAHVHLVAPAAFGPCLVANGVTLAREMGSVTEVAVGLRQQFATGELLGPELVVTGAILDGPTPIWPFSEACADAAAGRAAVRKVQQAGVDFVKVYSLLPADAYRAILAECKAVGLRAIGHVPLSVPLLDTAQLGQLSVEHLTGFEARIAELAGKPAGADAAERFRAWELLPQADAKGLADTLAAIAKAGQVHCPTLVVMEGVARTTDPAADQDPLLAYVPGTILGFWKSPRYRFSAFVPRVLPQMKALVAAMHKAGVPLVVGTDLANPYVFPGFSVHREMALWQELGIPAADILRSATITAATLCGKAATLGTIAVGKTASFVLLRQDPLQDIRHTTQIEAVWLRGRHLDRKALDGVLADARPGAGGAAASRPAVDMSLPGELVVRGTYRMTFGGQPAGVEEFVITQDQAGFHLKAWTRPEGGWQEPTVVELHADGKRQIQRATWERLGKKPLRASYIRTGARLEARADIAGKTQGPVAVEVDEDSWVGGPAISSDFLLLHGLQLAEAAQKEGTAVGFGFPDWQPAGVECTVTRRPDEVLAGATVRRYTRQLKSPMGKVVSDTWTDARGVLLKVQTRMPFGAMEAVLEQ